MKKPAWRRASDILWKIIGKFTDDSITLYSAQTAYFVVVSLIPFAAVLVPLLTLLIPDSTVELLTEAIHILPGTLGDIAERVLMHLFKIPDSQILVLYIIISLWAASKGIMSLQNGLHGIYHVKVTENYFIRRFRCVGYTFILLLLILFCLAFLILGNTLEQLLYQYIPFLNPFAQFIFAFRTLIGIVFFVFVCTAGYKYLAGSSFQDSLPGVILTTIGWMVFTYGFSVYVTYISKYITFYGSLGALLLLFLWLYFCLLILMVGAEFNVYFANKREKLGRFGFHLDEPERRNAQNDPQESTPD